MKPTKKASKLRAVPAPKAPEEKPLSHRLEKLFLDELTDEELAEVIAGMKEVAREGLPAAKHLPGEIHEVRADAAKRSFRILFATEGRYSQVLLSLSAFEKRTQKTPRRELDLADARLRDWRTRGAILKKKTK